MIRCYALVEGDEVSTNAIRRWQRNEHLDTCVEMDEITRLYIVVLRWGRGKKPRWVVEKELCKTTRWYGNPKQRRYAVKLLKESYGNDLPWILIDEWHRISHFSPRVQYREICSIFPECEKMPFAIALDYLHDRS